MWRWACAVALLALHAVSHGAPGMDPFNVNVVSQGEFARLPDYCRDTQTYAGHGDPTPRQARWLSLMGDTFWHLHHYCWGMLKANRAEQPGISPAMKRTLYASAVQECQYVLRNNADPDFVLRPEILYRMGRFEAANESWVDALEYYRQSIEAKADYWPPYVGTAEIHLRLKRRDRAIAILEEALKVLPNEPAVQQAMTRARDGVASAAR